MRNCKKGFSESYYRRSLKAAFFLNYAILRWGVYITIFLYIPFFFKINLIPVSLNPLKYLIPSIYFYSQVESLEYLSGIYTIYFCAIFYFLYRFFRIFGSPFMYFIKVYDFRERIVKILINLIFISIFIVLLVLMTPTQYNCIKPEFAHTQQCLGILGTPSATYIFHVQFFFYMNICICILLFINYSVSIRMLKKYDFYLGYPLYKTGLTKKVLIKQLLRI